MSEECNARVAASEGGLYQVYTGDGRTVVCKPRGKFRHERVKVLVGDLVHLDADAQGNLCIDSILPRKNALLRPPVSNTDKLFIIVSAASPEPFTLNVDKLSCVAVHSGITPVVVITKRELDENAAHTLEETYKSAGFAVFVTSCAEGWGIDRLRDYLKETCGDELCVFAGASGVGKSTLLNALFPGLSRRTQELSRKIARGRHTTRHVVLFPFETLLEGGGGFIADTPGFSLLDFESFDFFSKEDLPYTFPEFGPFLGTCRYTKCSHTKEEGCAVIAEVRAGRIAASRHESYRILFDQLKNKRNYG